MKVKCFYPSRALHFDTMTCKEDQNFNTKFSGVRRWSPSSLPPSGCRRVSPTRPRASMLNQRVMHPPASSAEPDETGASRWWEAVLGRRVFLTRHSGRLPPIIHPIFCYYGVWVLVTQYTFEITFTGDPGFVTSVSRANGPAFSEALPPRTFVLSFIFGLPRPSCCVFSLLL
jgi:hypothetical protein